MEQKLTRRQARENAFVAAFSATFDDTTPQEAIALSRELGEYPVDAFGEKTILDYYSHMAEINDLITPRLKNWTMSRLPKVSLTALRLALSEMLYGDERIPGVAINEAVELVKKYGDDGDYQFVNGLLGNVVRDLHLADEAATAPKDEAATPC